MARQQPVVAELGRPETPEETAARKAEASRLYRKRKTVNNLVFSLLVSLAVMVAFVVLVPQGRGTYLERDVDVVGIATREAPTAGQPLAAATVPDTWLAKQAELRHNRDEAVTFWYVGYNTPGDYAAVMQGFTAEHTPATAGWVAVQTEEKAATGTTTIGNREWTVYDHRDDSPDRSNITYGVVTELEQSTLIVMGTAAPEEIEQLAEAALASIDAGVAAPPQPQPISDK